MSTPLSAHERILIALDVDSADAAVALARKVAGTVGGLKVGLELINAAGFDIISRLQDAGVDKIFYDAKFHDIPNTVHGAVAAAVKRNVWMVNVHAQGGSAMLRAAADAAHAAANPPLLIGVTVLTSLSQDALNSDLRVAGTVNDHVLHLAGLCHANGLDGVVCSPHEVEAIRTSLGNDFVTVVPGVRPKGVAAHDQARIATPEAAVASGATYLVIGRAITGADDPREAAIQIAADIERGA
ncbi:MAG: hypothetical protein RL169_391 [Armatimonadota bacterium]